MPQYRKIACFEFYCVVFRELQISPKLWGKALAFVGRPEGSAMHAPLATAELRKLACDDDAARVHVLWRPDSYPKYVRMLAALDGVAGKSALGDFEVIRPRRLR